jgi:hypothetical protein
MANANGRPGFEFVERAGKTGQGVSLRAKKNRHIGRNELADAFVLLAVAEHHEDRKSTRLNSSH